MEGVILMTKNPCVLFTHTDEFDNMKFQIVTNGFSDVLIREFSATIKCCPRKIIDQFGLTVEGFREEVIDFFHHYLNWISENYQDLEIFIGQDDLEALAVFKETTKIPNCKWENFNTINLVKIDNVMQNSAIQNANQVLRKIANFDTFHNDFEKITYNLP